MQFLLAIKSIQAEPLLLYKKIEIIVSIFLSSLNYEGTLVTWPDIPAHEDISGILPSSASS